MNYDLLIWEIYWRFCFWFNRLN